MSLATADSRATAPPGSRLRRPELAAALGAALLGAGLLGWSLYIRTRAFGANYWIDEGLSIGIANHSFFDIPGVLRQDGSPPLYYVLLHFWIKLTGTSEEQTHALSLVFSTLAIPVGLWAGWSLFGRRVGILTAVVCAGTPFLTAYAQETRMYSLVALLSLVVTATFMQLAVKRDRRYIVWFALSLAALLYTHLWSAFLIMGIGVATLWLRDRELIRDVALGYAGAFVLYLPWVPTVLYQLKHTAAPWALGPTWRAAQQIPHALIGGNREIWITAIGAACGLFLAFRGRRERRDEWHTAGVVLVLLASTVLLAWTISQASGVWVPRYFAIFEGPLVLLLGYAFARGGVIGIATLAFLGTFWFYPHEPREDFKSNVKLVAADVGPALRDGDTVLTTHPEQGPLLYHYLPKRDVRFASELGYVKDPQVMDWRDGLDKLEASNINNTLKPILGDVPVGSRLLLIRPLIGRRNEWTAPWTSLVRRRSYNWLRYLERSDRFRRVDLSYGTALVGRRNGAVQGRVYLKTKP